MKSILRHMGITSESTLDHVAKKLDSKSIAYRDTVFNEAVGIQQAARESFVDQTKRTIQTKLDCYDHARLRGIQSEEQREDAEKQIALFNADVNQTFEQALQFMMDEGEQMNSGSSGVKCQMASHTTNVCY
jgi:hypothetical protein